MRPWSLVCVILMVGCASAPIENTRDVAPSPRDDQVFLIFDPGSKSLRISNTSSDAECIQAVCWFEDVTPHLESANATTVGYTYLWPSQRAVLGGIRWSVIDVSINRHTRTIEILISGRDERPDGETANVLRDFQISWDLDPKFLFQPVEGIEALDKFPNIN